MENHHHWPPTKFTVSLLICRKINCSRRKRRSRVRDRALNQNRPKKTQTVNIRQYWLYAIFSYDFLNFFISRTWATEAAPIRNWPFRWSRRICNNRNNLTHENVRNTPQCLHIFQYLFFDIAGSAAQRSCTGHCQTEPDTECITNIIYIHHVILSISIRMMPSYRPFRRVYIRWSQMDFHRLNSV